MPEAGARLLDEQACTLYLNGRHFIAVMTVPDRLPALAVGLLLGEQVIRSHAEIESILEEEGVVRVMTTDPFRVIIPRRGTVTGCGGAVTQIQKRRLPSLPIAGPVPIREVEAALERVSCPPAGLFSASLGTADGRWFESDDLGLTTALARVIGGAVLTGVVPGNARVAAVSHRVTAELVRSAVLAAVPILASSGPVTGLAVELAEQTGLSLCSARGASGIICHSHPEHLLG
ncbi:MAG: formate dehydrogenase accessory sulfurtransferase FdhD [Methanoregulaceae archaeon]